MNPSQSTENSDQNNGNISPVPIKEVYLLDNLQNIKTEPQEDVNVREEPSCAIKSEIKSEDESEEPRSESSEPESDSDTENNGENV